MKEETKKLVQWINIILNDHKRMLKDINPMQVIDAYDEKRKAAMKFLDSLPEIESHLCRGGYIQDRNGTPCCDGDNVKFVVADATDDEWCLGRLIWKPKLSAFQINSNAFTCFVSNVKWLEKVETHEVQSYKDIK